mgnify:FL=1
MELAVGISRTCARWSLSAPISPRKPRNVAKPKPDSGDQIFRVLPRQVDETVAAALREWLPGKSWSEIRRLLQTRQVMVSGNLCQDAGYRLRLVDVVKVLRHPMAPPAREDDVRIRYLDKHLAVVEKPAGMTTTRHSEDYDRSPRQWQRQPTLDEVLPRVIAKMEKQGVRRVRPVHRLDRETSGLLVFARTAEAQDHLEQQFRVHSIRRRYLAIARGAVEAQTIESRLVRDRGDGRRGSTTLPNVGKHSMTHVQPLERIGDYTLVECRLETGRTHQIRIHLAESGHPLCGEKVYGQPLFRSGEPDRSGAPRLMLAAVELGFEHPITGESLQFETPMPADFKEFLRQLKKTSKGAS